MEDRRRDVRGMSDSKQVSAEIDMTSAFLEVVERAAVACAQTMGQGDRHRSDQVAVESMRATLDRVPIDGRVVIGEGERDEAPMLYIGEKVGMANTSVAASGDLSMQPAKRRSWPAVDIAVDPLEGTNLCAMGSANAITVMAVAERGGLLHAPDLYMEKLVVGPSSRHAVDLDAPVADNLGAVAKCLGRKIEDLVVIVLDRPRHKELINSIRDTGARIRLIGDGDLSAGISAAVRGSGVHAVMGTGGAPEGVLVAAAMRCLNGEILARLVVDTPEKEERCRAMGVEDMSRIYRAADLACGRRIVFAATGVTDGTLMKGVRFFGDGVRTSSLIMQTDPQRIQFIDTIHLSGGDDVKVHF